MRENVFSLNRSSAYLRRRANENRRQGRLGEAATLLRLALSGEYPPSEALLWDYSELLSDAGLYDASNEALYEILQTCAQEEQSACFYALGENAYAQGDMQRAQEYFSIFLDGPCADEAYNHALSLLESAQAQTEEGMPPRGDRQAYAHRLMARALDHMRRGNFLNSRRLLNRARRVSKEANVYAMMAVCALAQENYEEAEACCNRALLNDARDLRVLCTLISIYSAKQEKKKAHWTILRALCCAEDEQELLMVSQCAGDWKLHGVVQLLCGRVLKKNPYHPLAAHLYAIACMNTGRVRRASRVWGRLARMLREDTIFSYYDHLAAECLNEGKKDIHIGYSLQVPPVEVQRRLAELSCLYAQKDAQAIEEQFESDASLRAQVRWLLYLPSHRGNTVRAAMAILSRVGSQRARRMLLTMLMGETHTEEQKQEALSLIAHMGQEEPCFVFIDGTLVKAIPHKAGTEQIPRDYEQVIQETIDRMGVTEQADAEKIVEIWAKYAAVMGKKSQRLTHARVWPLALEWAVGYIAGKGCSAKTIARREGVSARLIMRLGRRILTAQKESE